MATLKIPAIVLRQNAYRDNDRMLTLLSPALGRADVLARGCRRAKSPLLTATELFATGEFLLYEKAGRYTLTSAEIHEAYYPLRLDYTLLEDAVFLLKLCQTAAHVGQPAQSLFLLLVRALHFLSYRNTPPQAVLTAFLLTYADILGYCPQINACVKCGKKRPSGAAAYFDEREGGIVCTQCKGEGGTSMSGKNLKWMETVLTDGFETVEGLKAEDAPYTWMRRYVLSKIERNDL